MYRRNFEMFVGVAFGVLAGLFAAWTVSDWVGVWWPVAWVTGIALGGLTGYLAVDPHVVLMAIPRAWKTARSKTVSLVGWRPSDELKLAWRLGCRVFPRFLAAGLLVAAWMDTILLLPALFIPGDANDQLYLILLAPGVAFMTCVLCTFLFLSTSVSTGRHVSETYKELKQLSDEALRELNPLRVLFHWLPLAIGWLWRAAYLVVGFCICFVWQMYLLIHTRRRLIALADAALFTGVFYFSDNIWMGLLGAGLGGLWGVVNYHVIAIKVLKRQPA